MPIQRQFGIELEFNSSRIDLSLSQIRRELTSIVQAENHSISGTEFDDVWTIKTDHCGYEFTSPALVASRLNFTKVKNIVNGLKRICRESRRENIPSHQNVCSPQCGMHVHVDIDDLNFNQITNLVNIFRTYENAILSIQAPSRSNNNFVQLLQSVNIRALLERQTSVADITEALRNHYCAVSFQRYNERKTIEIRYASSTVSSRKVINWVQLLVFFVEVAKNAETDIQYQPNKTTDDLKEFIINNQSNSWLDRRRESLSAWIERRVEQIATYQNAVTERRNATNPA